jgi:glutamine---fructose-6-phosphate transaminase (isomerizing)
MCGIVGITAKKEFSVKLELLHGLKKLEYRGYDSAGFATAEGVVCKEVGEIKVLEASLEGDISTRTAIAHTRWATHGGVTKSNAHPHTDSANTLFLVHNGIVENYAELRAELEKKGCSFASQTDSEVIAGFLSDQLKHHSPRTAIRNFCQQARGTYAVVFFRKGEDCLYAFKKDSPLCIGICEDKLIVASDIYAFSHQTDKVIFLEDNEGVIAYPERYELFNEQGQITRAPVKVEWEREPVLKQSFKHYMLKEIYDQPEAVSRLLKSLSTVQKTRVKQIANLIEGSKRILFLACGTSYHASLIGAYLLSRLGYEAHAVIASEFENFSVIDENTLVFAVSQSGETMDIISVLKDIRKANPKFVAIVNYPYSTIHRLASNYIEIMAGQEICVAATKTFTNTLVVLFELARVLKNHIALDELPHKIRFVIEHNEAQVIKLAQKLRHSKDIFVLGHKVSYPISREIALKLKEICYIHAEGMMAGELKHGTIALVEPGVPVIGLVHATNADRMDSSLKEVESRGAAVYRLGNGSADFKLPPNVSEEEYSVLAAILGHLLSYHIAKLNGLPIDKPRNLAKCVTVK